MWERYSHLFRTMPESLRPHIRLYHTIVPCMYWGSCVPPWICGGCEPNGPWRFGGSYNPPRDPPRQGSILDPRAAVNSGIEGRPTSRIPVLLAIAGWEPSSGGVTSRPMDPFSAILIGLWFEGCDRAPKPMSSKLLFLLLIVSPCLNELLRLSRMSSTTLRELERPRKAPATVGLSGKDKEFDLVVLNGGALGKPIPDPRRLPVPAPDKPAEATAALICDTSWAEQKLMLLFLLELCRSKVFCAENGLGRTRYTMSPSSSFRSQLGFMIT